MTGQPTTSSASCSTTEVCVSAPRFAITPDAARFALLDRVDELALVVRVDVAHAEVVGRRGRGGARDQLVERRGAVHLGVACPERAEVGT